MAGTAGRSGRRPKPTARKELAGNPGKRALNKRRTSIHPHQWRSTSGLVCRRGTPVSIHHVGADDQRIMRTGLALRDRSCSTGALVRCL